MIWKPLTALTPLMARVMTRVECCNRSVRGDQVIVLRDARQRCWLHYRCLACGPEEA